MATIRNAGGITVVQRPETAAAPLMVESAVKQCPAALVLTLDEIVGLLRMLDSDAN